MSKTNKKPIENTIEQTSLLPLQKNIMKERYVKIMNQFEMRCFRIACIFHLARFIVTVGSLLVPALLSIQYSDTSNSTTIKDPDSFAYEIYWATWVISLLVTTSNGVLSTFKVDKKYYFLHTTLEQLRSEGWQFLELSGRYSGFYTPGIKPSHENQFIYFCHAIEKIKMKQVEEEYYKLSESHTHSSDKAKASDAEKKPDTAIIFPSTLLEQGKTLPPEQMKQMYELASIEGGIAPREIKKEIPNPPEQKDSEV